jgi:type II secretory pathway pseudopilin PulG
MSASLRVRHRGFGLLEIILVFALIIGASAIVFTVYTSAQSSADATHEAERLEAIAASLTGSSLGIQHNYSPLGSGYPGGGFTNTAIGAGFLKGYYTVNPSSQAATNQWGGQVTVTTFEDGWLFGMPTGALYEIEDDGIDPAVCPKLMATLAAQSPFYGVASTVPGSSSYSWIALQNPTVAQAEGLAGNMASPSFGTFAAICQNMYNFAGPGKLGIVVMGR